ncbi:hypothetical protein DOY81_008370 [Sarcophaga bullata]|nr:hypothetical protein DOY81_008370 [Sarcophaga bullata]
MSVIVKLLDIVMLKMLMKFASPQTHLCGRLDKYVAYLPNKLQMLVSETLGDEVVWKEQSQADGSTHQEKFFSNNAKTRYIQIQSLDTDASIICSNSYSNDYRRLDLEVLSENEVRDDSQITLNNVSSSETSSILKETTV